MPSAAIKHNFLADQDWSAGVFIGGIKALVRIFSALGGKPSVSASLDAEVDVQVTLGGDKDIVDC